MNEHLHKPVQITVGAAACGAVRITFDLPEAGDVAWLCDYLAGVNAAEFKEQLIDHVAETLLQAMDEATDADEGLLE